MQELCGLEDGSWEERSFGLGLVHKSSRGFTIRVSGEVLDLAFFTFQGLNE